MNANRMLIGLGVAVLVALFLSIYVYNAFKRAATAPVATPTNSIVVAADDLPLGTRLDASKVKTIPWPSGQPMAGMMTKVEDVQNRALITNVAENEPILENKLASVDSGAGLPATIPEGMRAVSVSVNDVVGVAGFVIPGTMVDVLVTGSTLTSQGTVTRTILENVRVLAAGQKIEQNREGKPENVPVITLLVAPEDAVKLTMAATQGKIQLALRNTVDTKVTAPAPVLQATLFGGGVPEEPTHVVHIVRPVAPPAYEIEVINGGKREIKSFGDAGGGSSSDPGNGKLAIGKIVKYHGQALRASESRMFMSPQGNHRQQRTAMSFARTGVLVMASIFSLGAPALKAQVPVVQAPPAQAGEAPEELHLLVGRSLIISSPGRIKRVSVADPAIAEAIVVTPYQVLLNGKAPGGVSLLIWDETDQSQAFEVSVDIDVLSLSEKIHEVFPSEPVVVESSKDSVMLSGKISSEAVADKILEVVKNATPKVTSLMEVPPPLTGQILLEVKFAEVDKTKLTQLGVNLLFPGGKNLGSISTQQFSPPIIGGQIGSLGGGSSSSTTTTTTGTTTTGPATGTTFGLSDLLNIFIYRPDLNIGATIQALQNDDVLQILAEPNVMTISGKEASFLAGGEFPYPVIQSVGSGSFPTISIQFKEFGVKLNFTPTMMADGTIHLKVTPEVSALDYTNALTISGFTIPALSTRRVTSEMDLRDGQSFAIAGLMDNRLTEQFSKIPWIGDLPVLGYLFKSRSLNKTRDELLVVVTPRIVHPLAADQVPSGPTFPDAFLPGPTSPQTAPPAIAK